MEQGRLRTHILASSDPVSYHVENSSFHHTLHCLGYLRQALMCSCDLTLMNTGSDLSFDGGQKRQCRDFDATSKWVMANAWDMDS